MTELTTINFRGNDLAVIEKDGKQYVAMKPIVEAMGLDWSSQLKLIKKDPVLSSTMGVTPMVAEDGKVREIVCLPLNKLNGWLFKIPASRYDGKKRRTIMAYQEECYDVLYQYFHHGAAVNSQITNEQLSALLETLEQEIRRRVEAEHREQIAQEQIARLSQFAIPESAFGAISQATGLPKDILVKCYLRSDSRNHQPQIGPYIQLTFNFYHGKAARPNREGIGE